MSARLRDVDPITVEILRNGVIAVTEEMKTNLMRTAYNMIIYEALDFTVGLFTADGDTVSIGLGLPKPSCGILGVTASIPATFSSPTTPILPVVISTM